MDIARTLIGVECQELSSDLVTAGTQLEIDGRVAVSESGDEVFRGRFLPAGASSYTQVAVKARTGKLSSELPAIERYEREFSALSSIEHSNVVRPLDFLRRPGLLAIVLEWLPGETLKAHLSDGPLDIQFVTNTLEELLCGVKALHEAGIVHCDLTPRNIIIGEAGVPTIIDLGISQLTRVPTALRVDKRQGTPDYVSPEFIETGAVSPQLDIYSAGIIGFEMITGEYPFKGSNVWQKLDERLKKPVPSPLSVRAECPPELGAIIERATKRNPNDRYRTADEMLQAIRHFQSPAIPLRNRRGFTKRMIEAVKGRCSNVPA